jgi:DNA-binding LacI/PurR family transcriptional regulator
LCNPALTTVQLPVEEMAREMVDRAMSEHADDQAMSGELVFDEMTLIERDSVDAPPGSKAITTHRVTTRKAAA